jgi:site-specific DNA recombinase
MAKRKAADPRKVVAYARVSTDSQADQGVSLDLQVERMRAYAALYDLEIVEVASDPGFSGKTLGRPGMSRALELIRSGAAGGLLVFKLDRLTRSVRDLGALLEGTFSDGGARLVSVSDQIDTSSASGRFVLHLLAAVSQWEREVISERTSAAMQHKRQRGEYTGGRVPYGYRFDSAGLLVRNEPEQSVINEAVYLRRNGWSYERIARSISKDWGKTTRTGKPFAPIQIARMLKTAAAIDDRHRQAVGS